VPRDSEPHAPSYYFHYHLLRKCHQQSGVPRDGQPLAAPHFQSYSSTSIEALAPAYYYFHYHLYTIAETLSPAYYFHSDLYTIAENLAPAYYFHYYLNTIAETLAPAYYFQWHLHTMAETLAPAYNFQHHLNTIVSTLAFTFIQTNSSAQRDAVDPHKCLL